ncbi:MAG: type I-C CRISPR-associated protein Cas5c [Armatimonadota bacterium]
MPPLEVKVWGDYACFTRPEQKVERVSYHVMTPSAARGILEAVFWKPEFTWQVREIAVLKPIRFFSILRNELQRKASPRSEQPFFIEDDRTQRHTLGLRDVAYVIRAEMALRPHCPDDPAKYRDQFRRRLERGQCFHRPALGCREFAADFAPPEPDDRPVALDIDLGLMLFDLEYRGASGPHEPRFFSASLNQGVLRVPQSLYGGRAS